MKKNKSLFWKTEKRKVSELIPYEHNPRKITPEQEKQLTKSLEKFNLAEIPAINTDNTIIAGHQRLKIMMALGRGDEYIDVRVPSRKLTEQELKEYNLRSNKNTAEWDFDILSNNFDEDMLKDIGFEIPTEEIIIEEVEQEIKYYKKVHILLSFSPDKLLEIQDLLERIKNIDGIEYEQSAN